MPKLSSGRHFGLEPRSLASGANTGTSEQMFLFVAAYRLEVTKPQDLCQFLPVIYFEEGKGEPPNAPKYLSGFLVRDILDARAGWSADEIEELKHWLETNEGLRCWLEKNFKEIDLAIRNSPLWSSDLMQSD